MHLQKVAQLHEIFEKKDCSLPRLTGEAKVQFRHRKNMMSYETESAKAINEFSSE